MCQRVKTVPDKVRILTIHGVLQRGQKANLKEPPSTAHAERRVFLLLLNSLSAQKVRTHSLVCTPVKRQISIGGARAIEAL